MSSPNAEGPPRSGHIVIDTYPDVHGHGDLARPAPGAGGARGNL